MSKIPFPKCKAERLGPREYQLLEDWVTPYGVIPKGFKTDGVTTLGLCFIASPAGKLFEAAVIHDWFYENAIMSKQHADKIFYQTALKYKVHPIRAYLAYLLVKVFGKGNFK